MRARSRIEDTLRIIAAALHAPHRCTQPRACRPDAARCSPIARARQRRCACRCRGDASAIINARSKAEAMLG
jgi:hypothetical protein